MPRLEQTSCRMTCVILETCTTLWFLGSPGENALHAEGAAGLANPCQQDPRVTRGGGSRHVAGLVARGALAVTCMPPGLGRPCFGPGSWPWPLRGRLQGQQQRGDCPPYAGMKHAAFASACGLSPPAAARPSRKQRPRHPAWAPAANISVSSDGRVTGRNGSPQARHPGDNFSKPFI